MTAAFTVFSAWLVRCRPLLGLLLALLPLAGQAQSITLAGPIGSGRFGTAITVLANGNYVVTDPSFSQGGLQNVGAVYLYSGATNALISTLTGSHANDKVGNFGITALASGNYLVSSPYWDGVRGAATWGSGTTGVAGPVSAANSLVGTSVGDQVGSGLKALPNGNYVVSSSRWNSNQGAATWGSGTTGIVGPVSAANSLVGTSANDYVGSYITALPNGNYVVSSSRWNSSQGAATWGNGTTGVAGPVSAANSLVGTSANDYVGSGVTTVGGVGIMALTNGNYVVSSPSWNGKQGAATWGSGSVGVVGLVSAANSLVGTSANDQVGNFLTALTNGSYVVSSPTWNGVRGAVTWGSGTTGVAGPVSAANSLVGISVNDYVGYGNATGFGVTPLTNGSYVVSSPYWNNYQGAATWGSGTAGVAGPVSATNSLVGTSAYDRVSSYGARALANGNYVVCSTYWNGSRGAATWGSGTGGVVGPVSAANSLVGSNANDYVSSGNITTLTNGSYVVGSAAWNNNRGAATWGSGTAGVTGPVSAANSLVGTSVYDLVGGGSSAGTTTALSNGNYVVSSPHWNGDRGAATWGSGTAGVTGPVSASNSLVGSSMNDYVGLGLTALTNGNYVVSSPGWGGDRGAATWSSGTAGVAGLVSAANSLVGVSAGDCVGGVYVPPVGIGYLNDTWPLPNGDYVVSSIGWNGSRGALTPGNGSAGTSGLITPCNSIVGSVAGGEAGDVFGYQASTGTLLGGLPAENKVQLGIGSPPTPALTASGSPAMGITLTSSAPTGNQFYLNGVLIAGATGQTYLVNSGTGNGTYTVVATISGGCASAASLPVSVTVTATAPATAPASLRCYPNPTHDGELTLELSGYGSAVELTVRNALGQRVYGGTASGTAPQALHLRELPAGVYLLQVRTADGRYETCRFVRE